MSKHRNKDKDFVDTASNHVIADYTQNEPLDFMERIHQVNRLCPGQSKQNINYLLKTNDYNVNETVRRINEEGAKELIGEWSKTTSKKSRKKKKNDSTAAPKDQVVAPPSTKPLNNLEPRPSSDSRPSKPSNSIPPKPPTAPQLPSYPTNSYHPVPPLETLSNSHLQPIHSYYSDSQRIAPTQRVSPNLSLGTSSNIQFLLLQLQTQSSQLAQWQDMLHQRMDNSLQILQFVFQQLQSSLAERHQLLFSNIENGKSRAHEIYEQRKKLAQKLISQAKKAPSEEVADSIKHFIADKQCDQQLADVYTLEIEHEAVLSAVLSLGDIVNSIPVYFNWSPGAGGESAPSHAPAVPTQSLPHPAPSKAPPKHAPPINSAPETQVPTQSFAPLSSNQTHLAYSEPDPAPPADTPSEPDPVPETPAVTSRIVTLKDPYSSEAKTVDLRSVGKTSKEDLEAARQRMQEMLDKQGRNMIVSEAGGRAMSGPGGRRGGERDARGGRGAEGNKGRGGGKRGPPARYQDEGRKPDSTSWDGSRDKGHVWSTEFTPSNQAEPDEAWDSSQYVESLELTNNNLSDGETDALSYNPITSVTSTEFKSSQQDYSPDEPPTHPRKPFPPPESSSPKKVFPEKTTAINWDNSPTDPPSTNWSIDEGDW